MLEAPAAEPASGYFDGGQRGRLQGFVPHGVRVDVPEPQRGTAVRALFAMVVLLQRYRGTSDAEAVELAVLDVRWQKALGYPDQSEIGHARRSGDRASGYAAFPSGLSLY